LRLSLFELMQRGAKDAGDILDRAEGELVELSSRVDHGDYADPRARENVKAYIRRRRKRISLCRRALFGADNRRDGSRGSAATP
jgi:hypothetical protein